MASDVELSDREKEILKLVATGVSNKEIAYQLGISPNTVKVHLRNVFTKIGAASRTEAALTAVRMGLVEQAAPVPESEVEPAVETGPNLLVTGVQTSDEPANSLQIAIPITNSSPRLRMVWWLLALGLVVLAVLAAALSKWGPFAPAPTPTISPTAAVNVTTSASRWSEVSALPEGRSGMAAVVFEGAIYLTGGKTSQGVTGSSLRYRPSQGGWESLADKPTPVTDVQAVVLGERIFVPGGLAATGKPVSVLEAYSPRLNRWDALAPMPAALSGYALAAFEGRIYLFGGWDGAAYSAAVYSYDPASDTWQPRAALPQARAFAAATVVESKIYVIGGYDGHQALRDLLVYLPDRDNNSDQPWEQRAPLPEGRYGMSSTALANMIYMVGGLDDAKQAGGLAPLVYQPLNDRWTSFDLPPEPVGDKPALLGLETRLHVLGGETSSGLLANHLTYQAIYTIAIPSIQQ